MDGVNHADSIKGRTCLLWLNEMDELQVCKLVQHAKCKVIGWEQAATVGHRCVLAAVVRAVNFTESVLLCEPSLAHKTTRPPDLVIVDPVIGVHLIEVKGLSLDNILQIEAGGICHFRYGQYVDKKNPILQVRNAMFDVRDAVRNSYSDELQIPFKYWVAFPAIEQSAWKRRWGENGFCPPEFLFADDLLEAPLQRRLGASALRPSSNFFKTFSLQQVQAVLQAFGDSTALAQPPSTRAKRHVRQGTLGELCDANVDAFKVLSDEQQRLACQNWSGGPRLVRGVAGSGKSVVLVSNLARRIVRHLGKEPILWQDPVQTPRFLVVCFNRTLVPFLKRKLQMAFRQRTGDTLPDGCVHVTAFNPLMFSLSQQGLCRYQKIEDGDAAQRAGVYLADLEDARRRVPDMVEKLSYDAVYVDEGQDFHEDEFRVLRTLCRCEPGAEPDLYVFYDDAQNLYGRRRPNWSSLGINVRGGRSAVMTECFRNTRSILEAAFNILFGSHARAGAEVPPGDFADLQLLTHRQLVSRVGSAYRIHFASRPGIAPKLWVVENRPAEDALLVSRLEYLIIQEQVRPQDVLVLAHSVQRVKEIAHILRSIGSDRFGRIHLSIEDRDELIGCPGNLSISTVASAKGFEAPCVLLVSADTFPTHVKGRAAFYVGCTRAMEYLEILAAGRQGLVLEIQSSLDLLLSQRA